MAAWLALLAVLFAWFAGHLTAVPRSPNFTPVVMLFLIGLIAWVMCFLWWVFSRAEMIDWVVWKRDQQRKERSKQRRQ